MVHGVYNDESVGIGVGFVQPGFVPSQLHGFAGIGELHAAPGGQIGAGTTIVVDGIGAPVPTDTAPQPPPGHTELPLPVKLVRALAPVNELSPYSQRVPPARQGLLAGS
jgi:hypothetical protein